MFEDYGHVLHAHVCTMLYPLQDGRTPLCLAVRSDLIDCVEYLLSNPGIDVNSEVVSWSTPTCVRRCYMFTGL